MSEFKMVDLKHRVHGFIKDLCLLLLHLRKMLER